MSTDSTHIVNSKSLMDSIRCTKRRRLLSVWTLAGLVIGACGGGGGGGGSASPPAPVLTSDERLRPLISEHGLTGDPTVGRTLPSINDPLPQLGKLIFFSKSLSGNMDTACASCHHPALGGGDGLSLPVGTGAINPDVVGSGRRRPDDLPNVGRHSQSVFNVGLFDAGLFWDSRIESVNKDLNANGASSGIRTPDTDLNVADLILPVGTTLPAAQARFPVTVPGEMRGDFLPGADGDTVRQHLAARIGGYDVGQGELTINSWLAEFQSAFASAEPAEILITFDNIALALAEYQRSMVFVDTPWKAYVEGDDSAISELAKEGALLFFRDPPDGSGCAACHTGDFLTDEDHHTIAFPQIGPGKGDGAEGDHDFGREQQTADSTHRFRFRTPTLLNLDATAPYGHAGAYNEARFASGHYFEPEELLGFFFSLGGELFQAGGVCALPQFGHRSDCFDLFPNVQANTLEAFDKVLADRISDPDHTFPAGIDTDALEEPPMQAFLGTLTDPCTLDRACLAPWIPEPDEAPDENQINATDADGNPL